MIPFPSRGRPSYRPAVEALETRLAPAVGRFGALGYTPPNLAAPLVPSIVRACSAGSPAPGGVGGQGGGVAPALRIVLERGPFQARAGTHLLLQRVSLRNEGSGTIDGPLTLVLDGLPPGVGLRQNQGIKVTHTAQGDGYVLGSVARLRPGQSLSVLLRFDAPGRATVPYRLRVL
jgi:hypothetical protein